MVPFRESTERAPTKTKKLSLVVEQKKLNSLRDKVKFRLRFVPLNIFAYAHGVRRKYSGSAEDIFLNLQYMVYFSLRPPKLAYLKYTSRLQTVNLLHAGWRGVTLQRHLNEGAAG